MIRTRYIVLALAVVVIIVAGGVILAGVNVEAPIKPVEKVIPNERFPR